MTSAAVVSAALRKAGFNPLGSGTPRTREGIRVGQAHDRGIVRVVVDLDSDNGARRLGDDVEEALEGLGFGVTRESESILWVTRDE